MATESPQSANTPLFRMGLIGKKLGMTQIFKDGKRIPVTVVQLGPCTVVQKKAADGKDGYGAIQIGFDDKPIRKLNKPMKGHFARGEGIKPKWILREIRVPDSSKLSSFSVGQEIKADTFAVGDDIDVTSEHSKGKGTQGVMKRHNMKGNRQATHGTHEYRRHTGSIGCRTTPGRVHPGKRMPGRMGNERVTTQNLKIADVDVERNLVLIVGAVPGADQGYVIVRQAVKKMSRALTKAARA